MWPPGPSASSSTRFARPSHTFRTTEVPRYSTQVADPVSGWTRRRRCVVHVPISKSKSCAPSRLVSAIAGLAGVDGACARAGEARADTRPHATRHARRRRTIGGDCMGQELIGGAVSHNDHIVVL